MRDLREHDGRRLALVEIEMTGELGGSRSGVFTFASCIDG
jgi:hypothetical protein